MPVENREIIDATQNAVLDAADSVVNALETTAQELGGHAEPFYQSAEFWVAMSFVLAVVALARPVWKMLRHMLRKRAHLIGKRHKSFWPNMNVNIVEQNRRPLKFWRALSEKLICCARTR